MNELGVTRAHAQGRTSLILARITCQVLSWRVRHGTNRDYLMQIHLNVINAVRYKPSVTEINNANVETLNHHRNEEIEKETNIYNSDTIRTVHFDTR